MTRFNPLHKLRRYGVTGTMVLLGHAANYFARKYVLRQRYLTRRIHNYRLRLDLRDPGLSRNIVISGTREDQLKYLLECELRPGNVVLDVGANIGYYTIMMARLVGPSGKIYALEPEPRNFALLNDNIRLNAMESHIEAFNLAASDQQGTARFYISAYSNLHTFLPYTRDGRRTKGISGDGIDVEMTDLSSFLEGKQKVDLIRMDIEGYEVEVLHGLAPAIESGLFAGKIVFECHFPKYDDEHHSMRRPLRWLFDHGYRVRAFTSSDERKTRLRERGYRPTCLIRTSDTRYRGVYEGISEEDALYFICDVGGVRDAVLARDDR